MDRLSNKNILNAVRVIAADNVRRLLSVLCVWLCGIVLLMAQPGPRGMRIVAEGSVVDSKTSEPLVGAAVKVTSADGGTGTFGICDSVGRFTFEVPRPGKYTLEVTYVGYKPLSKDVSLFPGRGAKVGILRMAEDPKQLAEVETVARDQRMKQVGDTIVYNAEAYKVADGATAEDLVGKMPGIEVTDEGVKAQGETVQRLTVDGKAFFENDPKMALKTLPAEVVQSVSVFDKKSDQAEFTGFDDGQTVKAMDLSTKSYRRNGTFGRVYGGWGGDLDFDRTFYNTGFNLNFFNGSRRISVLAMSNNVNQQNFTFDDLQASGGRGGGGRGGMGNRVGSQSGVSRANAVGVNFNNSYLDDRLDVQGSYSFKQTRTQSNDSTFDDYINTPRASIAQNSRLSHNYSHSLDGRITYRVNDRNQIIFRPSLNLQLTDAASVSDRVTWKTGLDTVLSSPDVYRADPTHWQNSTHTVSASEGNSWNVGGNLVWRHRFNTPGRTLSMGLNGQLSASTNEGDYVKDVNRRGDYYQRQSNQTSNTNWSGNLQWTETLAERQQLSLRYNVRYQRSTNEREISFYDDEAFRTIKTDTLSDGYDAANTNRYTRLSLRNSGEVAWRMRTQHWNMNANLEFEASHQEGEQDFYLNHELSIPKVSKTYYSLLPSARVEWRSENGTHVELNYRATSSNPSIGNLQQSVNTSDELHYSTGNPSLDQSVGHSLRIRLIHTNQELATNFQVNGEISTQERIGTQYLTNNSSQPVSLTVAGRDYGYATDQFLGLTLSPGARISRPVNMSGARSARLGLTYGFPFDLLWSNMNVSLEGSYSTSPTEQLYYDVDPQSGLGAVNDLSTLIQQWNLSPRMHLSSNISTDLDFSLQYQPSWRWVLDQRNDANSYHYISHRANARLNWTFWRGFTTEQMLTYSYYGGSAMTQTRSEWVWNMSVGKKFLRGNKAEVRLQANDLLNTRTGYRQSVSDSYVRDSYTNFMPRYFLLTLSYKLSNYRGSGGAIERGRGGRRQGREEGDFEGRGPGRGGRGGFGGPGEGGFGGRGGGGFGGRDVF